MDRIMLPLLGFGLPGVPARAGRPPSMFTVKDHGYHRLGLQCSSGSPCSLRARWAGRSRQGKIEHSPFTRSWLSSAG